MSGWAECVRCSEPFTEKGEATPQGPVCQRCLDIMAEEGEPSDE